jgi:histidyl-tRNA synthetase
MTPTLARMVAAKANALRKPIRWFSVPQLFRYERQQRGRLREHFQLNVDIVGEPDVTADAELLAVAIEVMRELGLSSEDVRARVSDRSLLRALLATLGVTDEQTPAVFNVVDKLERQPRDVSREKLAAAGMTEEAIGTLLNLMEGVTLEALEAQFSSTPTINDRLVELRRYFDQLERLAVRDWVTIDLTIVRGLAYYTGIVFELFDARGELRAICGGGRYDNLLASLGGVDLPALGFGMGDVVLGELLRERGYLQDHATVTQPDFWVAAEDPSLRGDVVSVATLLRRAGAAVEYALREQSLSKQRKASHSAGATYFVTLPPDFESTHQVMIDAFAETAAPTLVELLGPEPVTIERLVATVRANPQILSSTL